MRENNKITGQGISFEYFQIGDPKKGLFLRPSNQTKTWNDAEYFLKFIKEDKYNKYETLIPGRNKFEEFKKYFDEVKIKIEKEIPLSKEDYKYFPLLQAFKFKEEYDDKKSISSLGSSEFSIPSQSSSENGSVRQEKLIEYKIPTLSRRNTKASLFSNNSRNESPKIFKFDLEGRLIILSQDHPFLKNIDSKRKKIPQSYRNAFRIDNLTDKELEDLTDNYVNKVIAVGKPSFRA